MKYLTFFSRTFFRDETYLKLPFAYSRKVFAAENERILSVILALILSSIANERSGWSNEIT